MCSLNDIDGNCEAFNLPENPELSSNITCRSCKNQGLVVLRRKDVYCKDCFLATENHKFRATLGKSKMMKPQDRVLVAYSGSQSSTALLHLLHSGVTEDQHKRLLFSVIVLYVEEGVLLNKKQEEREEAINLVKEKVAKYKFPLHVSTLSEIFKQSPILEGLLKSHENDKQLLELFDNVRSLSSKEDLLYLLRQKLILRAAEQLNCNKIFTAEAGTDLAVKLLSSFSLGRGDQASFETGFCDPRDTHTKILRPLRDFTKKEIAFYNNFHGLEPLNTPSLTTKSPPNVSIRKLTEKFVTDLQDGFPSTVYTIFRTGEKLSGTTNSIEFKDSVCILCNNKLKTRCAKENYTAVQAADFSRNVSRKINVCIKEKGNCCGSCSVADKGAGINKVDLEKFICYGCNLIVRDMKTIDSLPKDIIQSAVQRRDLEYMKQQISEFLIEPS